MKQIINAYRNWRIVAVLAIAAIAMLLLISDNTTMAQFAVTKIIGLFLLFADCWLYQYWRVEGKLPEMDNITEED